jgi:hypothetical protein
VVWLTQPLQRFFLKLGQSVAPRSAEWHRIETRTKRFVHARGQQRSKYGHPIGVQRPEAVSGSGIPELGAACANSASGCDGFS